MSALSAQTAQGIFVVPADTLAQTTSDQAAVKALGVELGQALEKCPSSAAQADLIWQKWLEQAEDAGVVLPYQTADQRFSGQFPSYLPEEQKVIQHILWDKSIPALSSTRSEVLASIGAAGAGKSTLLKKLARKLIPDGIRIDPDEGVLENHGPYLLARMILQAAAPPLLAEKAEAITLKRNKWRLPPYTTFRWASNVINTEIACIAVTEGRNIEFHWTGAGAFGLKLIKDGYKAAGYAIHFAVLVTSLEERLVREAKRLRPATPEDFTNKAIDFIKLLPASLAAGDHIRIYDGDYQEPKLVFEYLQDYVGNRKILTHDRAGAQHVLDVMEKDISDAAVADKKPYLDGLSYIKNIIQAAPRPGTIPGGPDYQPPQ